MTTPIKTAPDHQPYMDAMTTLRTDALEEKMYSEGLPRTFRSEYLFDNFRSLERDLAAREAELERERIRLAACGVVAMANTPESAAKMRQMKDEYRSASLSDVERAVDAEMALRADLAAAQSELNLAIIAANTAEAELSAALKENAKLRKHAEAMAEDLWCEQVQDPNSTYHAYRADFPKGEA